MVLFRSGSHDLSECRNTSTSREDCPTSLNTFSCLKFSKVERHNFSTSSSIVFVSLSKVARGNRLYWSSLAWRRSASVNCHVNHPWHFLQEWEQRGGLSVCPVVGHSSRREAHDVGKFLEYAELRNTFNTVKTSRNVCTGLVSSEMSSIGEEAACTQV